MNASVEAALRDCRMPAVEIRWVLEAQDPATVHMLLELHRERLEEELEERRHALREIETRLTETSTTDVIA